MANSSPKNGHGLTVNSLSDPGLNYNQFLDSDGHWKWTNRNGVVALDWAPDGTITITSGGGGGGTPGGLDTQVQFNDAGSFGGDANLTWDKTTSLLVVGAPPPALWQLIDGDGLIVTGDGTNTFAGLGIVGDDDTRGTPYLDFGFSRGTFASPTPVDTNDRLGLVEFLGYTDVGPAYALGAVIQATAKNDWTGIGRDASLSFSVAIGSDMTQLLTIRENGTVTVDGSTNQLVLSGSSTGDPITISAAGSDSLIDMTVTPKGEGSVYIPQHSTYVVNSAALLVGVSPAAYTGYQGGFGGNAAFYSFGTDGGVAADISAGQTAATAASGMFGIGAQISASTARLAAGSITTFPSDNADTAFNLVGLNANAAHYGNGNMTGVVSAGNGLIGGRFSVVADGGAGNLVGTVSEAAAIVAFGLAERGNNITALSSVRVLDSAASGGTITTLYGLKVDDQTAGGTNYAVYTGAGAVRFGDTTTVAGADNSLVLAGSSTGNPVTLSAAGSDDDIAINLVTKGVGVVGTGSVTDSAFLGFSATPGIGIGTYGGDGGVLYLIGDGTTGAPAIYSVDSNGTLASPTTSSDSSSMAKWFSWGYDADNNPAQAAYVVTAVNGTPGSGFVPGRFQFFTATNTFPAERVRITSTTAFLAGTFSTTSPALKGGGAGATLVVRTADDSADAPFKASTITASTRTGTPAAYACFDSGGKLVESATPCV